MPHTAKTFIKLMKDIISVMKDSSGSCTLVYFYEVYQSIDTGKSIDTGEIHLICAG
jgi:hypothetical protein